MSNEDQSSELAVVLVDPVSSGRFMKEYVPKSGHRLIGVFTITDDELKKSGKFIPYEEKVEYCDSVIFSNDFDRIKSELAELPYKVVAVIAASEPGVELADQLADHLKLRGNSISSSLARRDKFETRRAIKSAGINGPAF